MTKAQAIYQAASMLATFRRHTTTNGQRFHLMGADGICRHPRYVFAADATDRWMGQIYDQETRAYLGLADLDTGVPAGCRKPDAIVAGIRDAIERFEASEQEAIDIAYETEAGYDKLAGGWNG
jgi:hypothetical protein